MALPSVLDPFNRANESPLSNGGKWLGPIWKGDGQLALASNVVNVASGWGDSYWSAKLAENQECAIKVGSLTTSRYLSPYVRIQNPNTTSLNAYTVLCGTGGTSGNTWNLLRVKATVETSLGTGTQALSTGGWIWLRAEGSKLQAIWVASGGAETLVLEKTDTQVTGEGFIGAAMLGSGASLALDDFSGGANGGGGGESKSGTSSITATASASATGSKQTAGISSVSASASASAQGRKSASGSSSISATSSCSASGSRGAGASSSIGASSSVSASGSKGGSGSSSISAAGALSAQGSKATSSASSIVSTAAAGAFGSKQAFGTSSITATVVVTAVGEGAEAEREVLEIDGPTTAVISTWVTLARVQLGETVAEVTSNAGPTARVAVATTTADTSSGATQAEIAPTQPTAAAPQPYKTTAKARA